MGKSKRLVPTEKAQAVKVKASCTYCYEALPKNLQKDVKDKPYRISSFDDLCEGHQVCYLKSLPEEDRDTAVGMINELAAMMNPMTNLLLANIPYLLAEKKKRDKEWTQRERDMHKYITDLTKVANDRVAAEEAKRQELIASGKLKAPGEGAEEAEKEKRPRSARKSSKSKKASEVVANMGKADLSPSQLMDLAGGISSDQDGVPKTVSSYKSQNTDGKSRRGRRSKKT